MPRKKQAITSAKFLNIVKNLHDALEYGNKGIGYASEMMTLRNMFGEKDLNEYFRDVQNLIIGMGSTQLKNIDKKMKADYGKSLEAYIGTIKSKVGVRQNILAEDLNISLPVRSPAREEEEKMSVLSTPSRVHMPMSPLRYSPSPSPAALREDRSLPLSPARPRMGKFPMGRSMTSMLSMYPNQSLPAVAIPEQTMTGVHVPSHPSPILPIGPSRVETLIGKYKKAPKMLDQILADRGGKKVSFDLGKTPVRTRPVPHKLFTTVPKTPPRKPVSMDIVYGAKIPKRQPHRAFNVPPTPPKKLWKPPQGGIGTIGPMARPRNQQGVPRVRKTKQAIERLPKPPPAPAFLGRTKARLSASERQKISARMKKKP